MKSIFKGKKVKEVYWFGSSYIGGCWWETKKINNGLDLIEYQTFFETDLSDPPLHKDERFYNNDTNETYYIEDVMRGTGDTMVYFTDKILEKVIDEESKQKAEEDKRKYEEEKIKTLQEEVEKLREVPKPESKKSWWKRLFRCND